MRRRPGSWRGLAAAALTFSLHSPVARADEARPRLDEVLRRAGALSASLEHRLAVVSATEEYQQGLLLDRDSVARVRRAIVSDVVWVPTGDAMVWAFFRDVVSVDGSAVVERANRLQELFASGATSDARRQAARLLDEGARYNLGRRRTVNTPTFALAILHPRSQSRFRFSVVGDEKKQGLRALKLRFAETARPTLTRTSSGADVPARGSLWIEPEHGALVASELRLDVPGLQTEIKVRFRPDERLGAWLPDAMEEAYGNRSRSAGEDRVEATARYSGFRRAETEVRVVLPGQ